MHTKYQDQFTKPGLKKMAVWKKIADEMSDDDSSVLVTATQCKQKWKNITKKFRDCVDYNSKTGNDKKECPFSP